MFYLFIFREKGKEREKKGETSMCGCLLCAPYWGPGPQPRHVPWLAIEPATFQFTVTVQFSSLWTFTVQHAVHWASPARASLLCRLGSAYKWDHMVFVRNTTQQKEKRSSYPLRQHGCSLCFICGQSGNKLAIPGAKLSMNFFFKATGHKIFKYVN